MAVPFIAKMLGGKVAQRFGKQQAGEIINEFIVDETIEKAEEVKEGLADKVAGKLDDATEFVEDVLESAPEVVEENGILVEVPKEVDEAVDNVADTTENKLIHKGLHTAEELPRAIKNGINAIPVIGGIGVLLGIIIFILFALKPIDGLEDEEGQSVTRLKLIWRVLIGRAEMKDELADEEESADVVETVIDTGGFILKQEIPIAVDLAKYSVNPFGTIISNQVESLIKNYSNFTGGN